MTEIIAVSVGKRNPARRFLPLERSSRGNREVVIKLECIFKHSRPAVSHAGVGDTFPRKKHIVGIGKGIVLSKFIKKIKRSEPQRMYGKLTRVIFLVAERIFHFPAVFDFVVAKAIGHETAGKPTF